MEILPPRPPRDYDLVAQGCSLATGILISFPSISNVLEAAILQMHPAHVRQHHEELVHGDF